MSGRLERPSRRPGGRPARHPGSDPFDIRCVPFGAQLADEWEALADRVDARPAHHPGWFDAWSKAFAGGRFDVITVRRSEALAAVLPVLRRRGVVRSVTNWHTPEFDAVAVDAAASWALARGLLETGARRIDLAFLDADAPLTASLASEAAEFGHPILSRVLGRSPYIAIDGDWQAYEGSLRGNFRREIHRRRRRLEELGLGPLSLEIHDGSGELTSLLDEALRIEAAGWKGSRGTAIASSPQTRLFYSEVARWAARRGWLRLAFLRAGAVRLAVDLAVETSLAHFTLKTGYDPTYRPFGPGSLLRYEIVKRAFELRLETYEFLGGADPWKLEWTDRARVRKRVQVFAPTAAGRADWLAFRYGRPGAKALLALPEVVRR